MPRPRLPQTAAPTRRCRCSAASTVEAGGRAVGNTPASKQLPGPPGLPWIGPLPQYLRSQKQFYRQITEWANEYGGVYGFELMGSKFVIVTGAY
jgi:hypothetical protein